MIAFEVIINNNRKIVAANESGVLTFGLDKVTQGTEKEIKVRLGGYSRDNRTHYEISSLLEMN
ncbi:hypothetical protein DN752_08250 [Echinicola strongylocentroti]|uniref:Uncharacterized protein n=1 Tax=Echinicola strongylocentroti TaxID=1795355 RepID=A0A2Z4IGR5_9BACT|nr:hypothetical protein [Echinicola strongylocentroti]AWW30115.1 hypothetical protein DN752_08250 [Echinicola strongylocentroti]